MEQRRMVENLCVILLVSPRKKLRYDIISLLYLSYLSFFTLYNHVEICLLVAKICRVFRAFIVRIVNIISTSALHVVSWDLLVTLRVLRYGCGKQNGFLFTC